MTYGTVNADIIQSSVSGVSLGAGNASIMKNRIINGDCRIDQRNAGASVTPTNGQYALDRWLCFVSAASKYTVQQNAGSVTPPVGFTNYFGVTSSSAYSVGTGEVFGFEQRIEGYNVADLGFGTSDAKTITISFWVRSSLTGSFGAVLRNDDNTRSYPFLYTISSANTWEYKTINVAGDTSGTWNKTNASGLKLTLNLGTGSTYSGTAGSWSSNQYYSATGATSVVGTNGATFYITGVQLEVGSSATGYEYRQYGQELALCQRYYEVGQCYSGSRASDYYATASAYFKVTKRANPTMTNTSSFGGTATNAYFGLDSWGWYQLLSANNSTVVTWYATSEL